MPHQFKRLSHSLYECQYQAVFCPKYRYRMFRDDLAADTRQQIESRCRQKEQGEVREVNIQPAPIHRVLSIPPKYAVSTVMGCLKGKLALRLFQRYEHLGRRYWGHHLWSRG